MPYRRTENVLRRLAAREHDILDAAREAASAGGMNAVQIAAIAERAGIAAGTVYRYFPSKNGLIAELIAAIAAQEIEAMRGAADAAPGPVSALAGALAIFATRALGDRRLTWAVLGEATDPETDAIRLDFRKRLVGEVEARIKAAISAGYLPEQDASIAAPAIIGAMLEGLVGPLAPELGDDPVKPREAVQTATLLALRALGASDARARGLVAQIALPAVQQR